MRYLKKQLLESLHFHSFACGTSYQKDMDDFCYAFTNKKDLSEDEKYAIFLQSYEDWVQSNFREGIYKEGLVRRIIFDDNGNLIPLNETIYNELAKIKPEVMGMFMEQYKKTYKNAEDIKKGRYPYALKRLAKLNKHDDMISFKIIQKDKLEVLYESVGERYVFRTSNKYDFSFSGISNSFKVMYEELFICEDNNFEYNLLLANGTESANYEDLLEISILFSEVELKRIKSKKSRG